MSEVKFVSPWEKYKNVASAVQKGDIEGALSRPELGWLETDLDSWVRTALNRPTEFDSAQVRFMDALSGTTPDESSLEARICQRWAAYPQIKAMMDATGLKKESFVEIIKDKIQHYKEHPDELQQRTRK